MGAGRFLVYGLAHAVIFWLELLRVAKSAWRRMERGELRERTLFSFEKTRSATQN